MKSADFMKPTLSPACQILPYPSGKVGMLSRYGQAERIGLAEQCDGGEREGRSLTVQHGVVCSWGDKQGLDGIQCLLVAK